MKCRGEKNEQIFGLHFNSQNAVNTLTRNIKKRDNVEFCPPSGSGSNDNSSQPDLISRE